MISVKKKIRVKEVDWNVQSLIDRFNHFNLMRADIISLNNELKKFLNKKTMCDKGPKCDTQK